MNPNDERFNDWAHRRKEQLERLNATLLYPRIIAGDRAALAEAITLIESKQPKHRSEANALISLCLPHSGKAWRIGITGVPGVGKSTFIEAIGSMLLAQGHRLAVMAIDPSSSISGGSILGDKTRMESLSMKETVFIRPSASGSTLGGVAQHTRESIILCEAAGYDVIIIETVGVGQSETVVHSMVDFFLLLMLSGAGDELQGIKRGIMEMADGILITKADQGNEAAAKKALLTYENALHLLQPKESGWTPRVAAISSIENTSLHIPISWWESFFQTMSETGFLAFKRKQQELQCFEDSLKDQIALFMEQNEQIRAQQTVLRNKISQGMLSPYEASHQLVTLILQHGTL